MKIVSDEKLITKNKKIGQVLTIFSFIFLAIGLYLFLNASNNQMLTFSFIALIIGFNISLFGIFYLFRWLRSPGPEIKQTKKIDQ